MLLSRNTRLLPLVKPCFRNAVAVQGKNYGTPAMVPLTESLDESLASHGSPAPHDLKVTKLDNGIKIASMEGEGGVSRVSVFIQAGSRYENPSNLGITHFLRNAAFLTNQDKSALAMVREMQQNGGGLEATCSRDHFIYSGSCTRDSVPNVLENIAGSIRGPLFQHWEIEDARELCDLDRAYMDVHHQKRLLDSLHGAAYRNGLGNSMFCQEHVNFSAAELKDFMSSNFVGERLAVVAVGCDHDQLVKNVSSMLGDLPGGVPVSQGKPKYFSGEARVRNACSLTHAALVAEGAGHQSKDIFACSLLQMIMGTNPVIKRGSNTASSRINRSALSVAKSPYMVTSLNINHSDNGMVGFYAITEPNDSSTVLKSVLNEFKDVSNGKINEEEMRRAKKQLKSSILMTSESKDALVEDIANQIFSNGQYKAVDEVCSEVDNLRMDDIVAVAKRLFIGKSTYAVLGDCSRAPYLDELL